MAFQNILLKLKGKNHKGFWKQQLTVHTADQVRPVKLEQTDQYCEHVVLGCKIPNKQNQTEIAQSTYVTAH